MSYISAAQAKQITQKAVDNLKDGTLVPKLAENLTPYAEDSGTTQTQPFFLEGTATGNGESRVDAKQVPAFAFLQEKRGNMVCVNQLFPVQSTQTVNGITFTSNGDGSYTLNGTATATAGFELIFRSDMIGFHVGRTMLMLPKTEDSNLYLQGYNGLNEFSDGGIFTMPNITSISSFFRIRVASGTVCNNVKIHPILVDLTQWFNGNIPVYLLSHPEAFGRYYKGPLAYEPGRLEPATGRYLTSVGRNIWDEEWESGSISPTGVLEPSTTTIRAKNYINVAPSTAYYCRTNKTVGARYFDDNEVCIGTANISNTSFVVPANCSKMKFVVLDTTTYNNDITISLYYSGESGYDKYYPHEVLATIDTGTESLYSAGSAYDSKVPSGLITRRIGSVDLGTLNWESAGISGIYYCSIIGIKQTNTAGLMLNSNYTRRSDVYSSWSDVDKVYGTRNNYDRLYVKDSAYTDAASFKAAMTGVMLYFELATPTTEQGTPFQESVPIDDFGQLSWSNTDVPQGNQIFYPVDYKAYLDSLVNHTNGDPTSIALVEDVENEATDRGAADTILQNAIGGTLRQCLCVAESLDFDNTAFVDLGDLNWYYVSGNQVFIYTLTTKSSGSKLLCTSYKTEENTGYGVSNMCITGSASPDYVTTLFIKNTNYTDATTFKAAMKGILLAYEKA